MGGIYKSQGVKAFFFDFFSKVPGKSHLLKWWQLLLVSKTGVNLHLLAIMLKYPPECPGGYISMK